MIRVNKTFGLYVTLMTRVTVEVAFFLLFFLLWIMLFAFIFIIIGFQLPKDANGDPEDFNGVNIVARFVI